MHSWCASHAVMSCRAWGYLYTFQRARVASSPDSTQGQWWKVATFLRLTFTLLTLALITSRHFRKLALRLGIILPMFRECLCVVARQHCLPSTCQSLEFYLMSRSFCKEQCKWLHYCQFSCRVHAFTSYCRHTHANTIITLKDRWDM